MFKKIYHVGIICLLTSAISYPANAAIYSNGSKTQNFDVTMTIVADCNVSISNLDFGQNQGLLTNIISTNTTMNVTCSNTTPYNIGLNAGTGAGSSGTTRYMNGTGANMETVKFNLYQDNGNIAWGNTQGTDTKSGIGTGVAQTITIYGQIPVQNTPKPDSYKSTVTATVYF